MTRREGRCRTREPPDGGNAGTPAGHLQHRATHRPPVWCTLTASAVQPPLTLARRASDLVFRSPCLDE